MIPSIDLNQSINQSVVIYRFMLIFFIRRFMLIELYYLISKKKKESEKQEKNLKLETR